MQIECPWASLSPFYMYGTLICIFKQAHYIGLYCFLQGEENSHLEAQVPMLVLCSFLHPLCKGQFSDQEAHGLLESLDLPEDYSFWPEPSLLFGGSPTKLWPLLLLLLSPLLPSLSPHTLLQCSPTHPHLQISDILSPIIIFDHSGHYDTLWHPPS